MIWWYLSGVITVLVIWILLNYIVYRRNHELEITSSEIVYGVFTMLCSWIGIGVNIIAFIIWWALQYETVFSFKKKEKEKEK